MSAGWQKTKMSRVRWRKRTLEDRQFVHKDEFRTAETEIGGTGVVKSLQQQEISPRLTEESHRDNCGTKAVSLAKISDQYQDRILDLCCPCQLPFQTGPQYVLV